MCIRDIDWNKIYNQNRSNANFKKKIIQVKETFRSENQLNIFK